MLVWQVPRDRAILLDSQTALGFDTENRWRWKCGPCRIECSRPYADCRTAHLGALGHLQDEHQAHPA